MDKCKNNPERPCVFPFFCIKQKDCWHDVGLKCEHLDTVIVVLEVFATCEKTALRCKDCGKILTKIEVDCR